MGGDTLHIKKRPKLTRVDSTLLALQGFYLKDKIKKATDWPRGEIEFIK